MIIKTIISINKKYIEDYIDESGEVISIERFQCIEYSLQIYYINDNKFYQKYIKTSDNILQYINNAMLECYKKNKYIIIAKHIINESKYIELLDNNKLKKFIKKHKL